MARDSGPIRLGEEQSHSQVAPYHGLLPSNPRCVFTSAQRKVYVTLRRSQRIAHLRRDFALTELPECGIHTAEAQEFFVAALFDKPPAIHDQDVVAVRDRR
jgi:hypothetical protein